jgi:aldehyde dehydrogenase
MLAAGNVVVFNVHPSAKQCSMETVVLLNKAITAAGGPPNAAVCVADPTIESAGQLMKHPGIRVIVVTGGGGVVKAAMSSGKRAICAGPGNPPVVVDETADIEKAAATSCLGASFDNNVICVEEKETIVVASVADKLIQAMTRNNAVLIDKSKIAAMEQVIFSKMAGPRGHAELNRKWIGQNADKILAEMGISAPSTTRLAIVEVPEDHPLLWTEQMMPVMPITRVPNADYAIDLGIQMEAACFHTALMHSKQHRQALQDGPRLQLLHLRQERPLPGRPRLRRRRLHLLHHRLAHRRRPHHPAQLLPLPPLHAGRPLPDCLI